MTAFAVVVLAAGGSARMGRPKQLLDFRGKPLVRHAVEGALASGAAHVVVVVGAHADKVAAALEGLAVTVARNACWEEGMASSIRVGIEAVAPGIAAAVLTLADQPLVPPDHLAALARLLAERGVPVTASAYDGVLGVPAAFARSTFPDLRALTGDTGARSLLRRPGTLSIPLTSARLDVDTPADLTALDDPNTGAA